MQYEVVELLGVTIVVAMIGGIRKSTIITGDNQKERAAKWLSRACSGYVLTEQEKQRLEAYDPTAGVYRRRMAV
jgi:hypothetical protein